MKVKMCLYLSRNYKLDCYSIVAACKAAKVEFMPFDSIFNLLKYLVNGCNVILVRDKAYFEKYIHLLDEKLLSKVFIVKDNSFDLYDEIKKFTSYEEFFKSKFFNKSFVSVYDKSASQKITDKFNELGITGKGWKHRYIKTALCEMYKSGVKKIGTNFFAQIRAMCEVEVKQINDNIRPLLKKYTYILASYKNEVLCDNITSKMLMQLYDFIFNDAP